VSFHDDERFPSLGAELTGHPVFDQHHDKVGRVSDVVYDEMGEPKWAIVDPGPLRSEKFVPVEGAYTTNDGDVVVPYDKSHVKTAPKVSRDHIIDSATERRLVRHYELADHG
jgi:uncharacterized protein YrrD